MKKLLAFLLLAGSAAFAQQGVPGTLIQQSPTMLNACSVRANSGAVNAQVTSTLTPPSGWSVYICGLDFTASNNGTAAVTFTTTTWTSTNLSGWAYQFSSVSAINLNDLDKSFYFVVPIKSAVPGTAVTIVSPAANADAAYNQNIYYYFAP
jgi:hypothetical protein